MFGSFELNAETFSAIEIGTFFLITLGFFIVSSVLLYHWRTYTIGGLNTRRLELIYFSTSFVLLVVLFGSFYKVLTV